MAFNEIATGQLILEAVINERQITDAATRAAQNFNATFNRVQQQFATSTRAQQVGAVQALSKAFQGLGANLSIPIERLSFIQRLSSQTTSALNSIGTAATGAAIGITALAAASIKIGISFGRIAGDFQALEQSLTAITNNSETAQTTANEFIGSLRQLALQSGRSSSELANVGRQFLALGFSGDKTNEILETFTRAAGLTSASNEQLRLALFGVSQIASKGTVAMEELRRQIAENLPGAINLARFFEILGQRLGVTTEEARKLQEQGKITADVGIEALLQTINETVGSVDVFEIRARTLSGQLGILTESFRQTVQDGFRPFIDSLVPALRNLTQGQSTFSQITPSIQRLGQALGTSLSAIIQELAPILPPLIALFAKLAETFGPLIVDVVKIGSTIARILIPIIDKVVGVIDILLNKLGPLSFVLRQLAAGVIVGGIVRAFGAIGNIFGRFSALVANATEKLNALVPIISKVATVVGLLRGPLSVVGDLLGKIGDKIGLDTLFDKLDKTNSKLAETTVLIKDIDTVISRVGRDVGNIFNNLATAAEINFDKVRDVISTFRDNLEKVIDSQKSVESAQASLVSANRSLSSSTEKLNELEDKRRKLLADTARDVKEIVEAEEELTRIRFRLRDLGQEEVDIQNQLNELRTPATQEELATADRDIERAKIALNRALRAEQELTEELNDEQIQSINLAGLSLDQIRSRLANIRATLAAQRATARVQETQRNTEEEQLEARLNVQDAQQALNDALLSRTELEDRVKNNAIEIREAEERLTTLALDRASALRDETEAQQNLNNLRAGDTSRAKEIRDVEKDIKQAREDQIAASEKVREAEIGIRDAKLEQKQTIAEIRNDETAINNILLERLGLNQRLLAQQPELLNQVLAQFLGLAASGDLGTLGVNQIAAALLDTPNALRDVLRKLGVPLAEGGLITQPTFAQIGERFKHELVLPLTKPDRVWELLSHNLPRYPGALTAAQRALSPSPSVSPAIKLGGAARGSQSYQDMPLTRAQGDEIIRLLRMQGKSEIKIEAPIQVSTPVADIDVLARKTAKHIERTIERNLR